MARLEMIRSGVNIGQEIDVLVVAEGRVVDDVFKWMRVDCLIQRQRQR